MKTSALILPILAAGFFSCLPGLQATTLINDNFSTNPSNPNTVGWYSSAGTVTTFSGDTGALQFIQGDTSTNVSVFKQFTQTQLAVGETLQLSFQYTALTSFAAGVANSQLRIGLFDTSNTFTSNQGTSPWSTTNEGYTMGIGTGTTAATSNFFYRTGNAGLVSTGSPSVALGATDTLNITDYATMPVSVSFSITRTDATTMFLEGAFTQNSNTSTFTDKTVTATGQYVDTFDTLFIGFGTALNGRGFTIENVNLQVVPEPTMSAMVIAGLSLLVAARRRRLAQAGTF